MMAKYCGRCGSQLHNDTGLCPNCDSIQATKKSKKKPLVIVFLVTLAVVIVVFSFISSGEIEYLSSNVVGAENKNAIIYDNGNEYYMSGGGDLYLLKGKKASCVKEIYEDSDHKKIEGIYPLNSVFDGKVLYAEYGEDNTSLYKYTFVNDCLVEKSVWVSGQTLNDSVVTNRIGYYTQNMEYWSLYDNYVYFICVPPLECFHEQYDIAYQLGRISIDGSKIEFIGETASTYAIKDGWIYFYDNGFSHDKTYWYRHSIDDSRAGIYKMNISGGQKKLLLDGFINNEAHYIFDNKLCDNIKVFGDYLYFIDKSEKGKGRVCRMTVDGTDEQFVTQNGAYAYTVDTDRNELYYLEGEPGVYEDGAHNMYRVSLVNGTENIISDQINGMAYDLSCVNDYIYIQSSRFNIYTNDRGVCGIRYNISKDKLEYLNGEISKQSDYGINRKTGGYELNKTKEREKYVWGKKKR